MLKTPPLQTPPSSNKFNQQQMQALHTWYAMIGVKMTQLYCKLESKMKERRKLDEFIKGLEIQYVGLKNDQAQVMAKIENMMACGGVSSLFPSPSPQPTLPSPNSSPAKFVPRATYLYPKPSVATVTSVTKNREAEFDDDDGIEKHMLGNRCGDSWGVAEGGRWGQQYLR